MNIIKGTRVTLSQTCNVVTRVWWGGEIITMLWQEVVTSYKIITCDRIWEKRPNRRLVKTIFFPDKASTKFKYCIRKNWALYIAVLSRYDSK